MSHPDPQHDPENSRADDDLLRGEIDFKRQEEENEMRRAIAEQDYIDAYRDKGTWRAWATGGSFPGQGAGGLDIYYNDAKAPQPEKEEKKEKRK